MSSCWGSGEDEYNNISPNINNNIATQRQRAVELTKPVSIEKTANCWGPVGVTPIPTAREEKKEIEVEEEEVESTENT